MSLSSRSTSTYNEIHRFSCAQLEEAYRAALESFLPKENLKEIKIKFVAALSEHKNITGYTLTVSSKKSKDRAQLFSCRLQSFPGCCGYLIMSGLHQEGLYYDYMEQILTPLIKGVFNLGWYLNYQTIFSTHVVNHRWSKILGELFEEACKTGPNRRTSHGLVYFTRPVNQREPDASHKISEEALKMQVTDDLY